MLATLSSCARKPHAMLSLGSDDPSRSVTRIRARGRNQGTRPATRGTVPGRDPGCGIQDGLRRAIRDGVSVEDRERDGTDSAPEVTRGQSDRQPGSGMTENDMGCHWADLSSTSLAVRKSFVGEGDECAGRSRAGRACQPGLHEEPHVKAKATGVTQPPLTSEGGKET